MVDCEDFRTDFLAGIVLDFCRKFRDILESLMVILVKLCSGVDLRIGGVA